MTLIVTAAEMRAAEAAAISDVVSEAVLMRRAAEQIAEWVDSHVVRQRTRRAIALTGPGNNGGDALVTLALLHERGWTCGAVLLGRSEFGSLPADEDSLANISRIDGSSLHDADVILDGVYGIGGRASLPDDVSRVFKEAVNERMSRGVPLIAIDVPSGIDATIGAASPDAFRADVTLCLGLVKRGLLHEPAASFVGDLEVLPIGIPDPPTETSDRVITIDDVRRAMPRRQASAHKSDTGTVLIISGAPQYYGAPRMVAEAALRAGAGLVALATLESIVPVVAAQLPEVVFVGLPEDPDDAVDRISAFVDARSSTIRAMVVGPGIGTGTLADVLMSLILPAASATAIASLPHAPGLVIDADGLNWLSEHHDWHRRLAPRSAVLTPHAGEMARLLRVSRHDVTRSPHDVARSAAIEWQQYVVLKGGVTALATPAGELWVSPRSTPELATAGTGDVLAGMIGGFMSQGLDANDASMCALWIGAMAGRAARNSQSTQSVIARDVTDHVGRVMNTALEPSWRT